MGTAPEQGTGHAAPGSAENLYDIAPPDPALKRKGSGPRGITQQVAEERGARVIADLGDAALPRLREELQTMFALMDELARTDDRAPIITSLYNRAHEMKGEAGTYDLDLVTSIGRLLTDALDRMSCTHPKFMGLVRAHLDALRVILDGPVRGQGGVVEQRLVAELAAAGSQLVPPAPD